MRKKIVSLVLLIGLTTAFTSGCNSMEQQQVSRDEVYHFIKEIRTTKEEILEMENPGETDTEETMAEGEDVLKFYHAYFHEESEWPVAAIMRSIYQEFADQHADGPVKFEAIAVENVLDTIDTEMGNGTFPEMVDLAGNEIPADAIVNEMVLNMKDFVDSQGLQSKVGINYTMNMIDGGLYTIHDQLTTIGLWYNADAYEAAGATTPDTWKNYEDMVTAMEALKVQGNQGIYAYSAGQGSIRLFNAYMGLLKQEYVEAPLTAEIINSKEFATVFKTVASMDQSNGAEHSSDNVGDFSKDFNEGKCATFLNGVWGAGGFTDLDFTVRPGIYPGNVSLSAPGGGLTISDELSEAEQNLALEFVRYMTSDEIQTRIFLEVNANPCNTDLDLNTLAAGSGNETVKLLAEACSMANQAETIVNTINLVWGADVQNIISNKLIECAEPEVDIDEKLVELKAELIETIS